MNGYAPAGLGVVFLTIAGYIQGRSLYDTSTFTCALSYGFLGLGFLGISIGAIVIGLRIARTATDG